MEPEPSLAALLKAITALSATVGSLQDQVRAQSLQITKLRAICKETVDLLGDKDQGAPQTKPGPLTGPTTLLHIQGGNPHSRHGSSVKRPKMELPDPYKGDSRGRKATQWLDRQGKSPTTIPALTAKFKEAFADPDAKRAAARKIAALTQTATTSEYVTEFRNLMAELDWNTEAYIAQFTRGLHWKVKELLSTKDNIPDDDLEAIFAASAPTKAPVTTTTSTSTTTTRVRLLEDPNYVTPEEQDRRRASGLCVKCGQKGHGIKQCPNGWKATIKEAAKIGEVTESEKE
ncbi:Retrotransposon-derived protein PEG10 [Rhizoctonia solani]|uniref:Retrotransposon-derived protein PEG10 n=1 Tax=Rhizoctonia solani TaxID=456999 RepID=A0A8H7IAV9_9AGAM|nr:Retrotransposon-derived protein PEG10 [Rhizoctonia solani]